MTTLRARYEEGRVLFLDPPPDHDSPRLLVTFLDEPSESLASANDFVARWAGAFKGLHVGDLKDERIRRIEAKHK